MKRIFACILVFSLLFSLAPQVLAVTEDVSRPFAGKTLSILGDSISTFQNYSNGTASQTTNSTITSGAIYYPRSGFDVTVSDTWWMQFANALGMEVLVNNSWSGSCIYATRAGTVGAYIDRCVQLHDNTGANAGQEPDMIAVYLGTNDYYSVSGTLGTLANSRTDALMTRTESGYTYATPVNSIEAYAIMLHKIRQRYPDAEVYCFTLIPHYSITAEPKMLQFNADIRALAGKYGAYVVDLSDCGIHTGSNYYQLMGDTLHPNSRGMDALTNAFLSSVYLNSKYMPENAPAYSVSYDFTGVYALQGTPKTACGALTLDLAVLSADRELQVKLYMGGLDITESCYANGKIRIENVTADVRICASAIAVPEADPAPDHAPANYRWEYDSATNAMVSVTTKGNTENLLTLKKGTLSNGTMSGVSYQMEKPLILKWNQPWTLQWRSTGSWNNNGGGGLLFSERENSTQDGRYFYRRYNTTMMGLGVHTGGNYLNYCAELSGKGIDATLDHTYSLTNVISEAGSNMVYLYIDGVQIGALDQYYLGATDKNTTSDWVVGKNFQFSYLGAVNHTLDNCKIDYIQVWEAGEPVARVGEQYYASFATAAEHAGGQWIQLLADVQENAIINSDVYVDLNGHSLSGIGVNGTVYGADSATDGFDASAAGKLALASGTVAPQAKLEVKEYLAVPRDGTYSFHHFQAQITTVSLRPAVTGFGYKAVFAGDSTVQAQIESYGYRLWMVEDYVVERTLDGENFVSGDLVTLRLQNFLVEEYGKVPVNAQVFLRLKDGTVLESQPVAFSLYEMLQIIDKDLHTFSPEQIAAIKAMCQKYEAISGWELPNLQA